MRNFLKMFHLAIVIWSCLSTPLFAIECKNIFEVLGSNQYAAFWRDMTGFREKQNMETELLQRSMLQDAIDKKLGEIQEKLKKEHDIDVPTGELLKFLEEFKAAEREKEHEKPEEKKTKAAEIPQEILERAFQDIFVKLAKDPQSKAVVKASEIKSFKYEPLIKKGETKTAMLGTPGNTSNELPREVTLTKSFEMQSTPVTQLQWALVMGDNPSDFKDAKRVVTVNGIEVDPDLPVEKVSWNEVKEFIERLNKINLRFYYRLPTEAEWEYSVRGGTSTAYHFGDDPSQLGDYAWFTGNSEHQTQPVGQKKPNQYGLYDMMGNVAEWIEDIYI